MRFVVFGLTITSSWGNGHATIWRSLADGLARAGHQLTFCEREVPYYAQHRDGGRIAADVLLYQRFEDALAPLARADVAIVTSFCPDALAACEHVLSSRAARKVFYDLDTGVTLDRRSRGLAVEYLPEGGLSPFDLVLSFTGGRALDGLQRELGARRVAPLYGSVDPEVHHPVAPVEAYAADLSYLGTYAEDRQRALDELLLRPAAALPERRFRIGGSQYPSAFPWRDNVWYSAHVPPPAHPAFFCSSRLTLNVTRAAMAAYGHCPSGRLFEAAACGAPLVSDWFDGLDAFFGDELVIARSSDDVVAALSASDEELSRRARRARDRVLSEHTGDARAAELIRRIEEV